MKLQASAPSGHEILQSQISLFAKNRFNIKELTVVHGRRFSASAYSGVLAATGRSSVVTTNLRELRVQVF